MVGRDRELSRVTRLLDDALAGQGRLLLCTGEAGIGKTRLGEELTAAAAARGVPVAWARAADRGSRRRTACGGWSWMSPPSRRPRGRIPPDLWSHVFGDAGRPVLAESADSGSAHHFALFAEVRRRLAAAAGPAGPATAFDDLQWADVLGDADGPWSIVPGSGRRSRARRWRRGAVVEQRGAPFEQAAFLQLGGAAGPAELVVPPPPDVPDDEYAERQVGQGHPHEELPALVFSPGSVAGQVVRRRERLQADLFTGGPDSHAVQHLGRVRPAQRGQLRADGATTSGVGGSGLRPVRRRSSSRSARWARSSRSPARVQGGEVEDQGR